MQSFKNRSIAGSAALIATFATIIAATPLWAEPVGVPVAYGDLDIHSEAGAAILDARLRRAAYRVCGQEGVGNRIEAATCRHQAIDAARTRLALNEAGSSFKVAAR